MIPVITRLFLPFIFSFSFSAFAAYELPKTGQEDSYLQNDDGELKLGNELSEQRFTDNFDGTVTDNLTGLMWIRDSYCANHYISGAQSSNWNDVFGFVEALNEKTLISNCKGYQWTHSDWRVPNINELKTLVPHGLIDQPSILNWLIFPSNNSSGFTDATLATTPAWSSTTDSSDSNKAWVINLNNGETQLIDKSSSTSMSFIFSAVREKSESNLITTGQHESFSKNDDGEIQNGYSAPKLRFVPLDDGTVVDKLTGLNWLQDATCARPGGSNWQLAINSTFSLLLDPPFFTNCLIYNKVEKDDDWRIPNFNELASLINYSQNNPALDSDHPFTIATDKPFWSSTSSNNDSNNNAWAVSLQNGALHPHLLKTDTAYAWPVRGPIDFADLQTNILEIQYDSHYVTDSPIETNLVITNTGNSTLTIDNVFIGDSEESITSANYSIGRDGCSNRSIEPNTTCSTTLLFKPKSTGVKNAFIIIESNALGIEKQILNISGKGIKKSGNDDKSTYCFIATAAYGSYLAPEVETLRSFRDQWLLKSTLGTQFVNLYYEYSPSVATIISDSPNLRTITQIVLTPIVYSIKFPIVFWTIFVMFILLSIKRYTYKTS